MPAIWVGVGGGRQGPLEWEQWYPLTVLILPTWHSGCLALGMGAGLSPQWPPHHSLG